MDRSTLPGVLGRHQSVSPAQEDVWITMTELRRHFYRVIREVENGTTFTIVRRGRSVARLVPIRSSESGR